MKKYLILLATLLCSLMVEAQSETALPKDSILIDVMGDSYVRNHKRPWTETWHYKMAQELGYAYRNYGRNGACVAFDRTHDGKYNFGPAMTTKVGQLDPRADYVLLIAGHNDAGKVGNNKDSLQMFRLALDSLIVGIQKQCPHAKIGYVTPWYNDMPGFEPVVKVIRKVCKRHHVPVLDNYNKKCVIQVRDAAFRKQYFQRADDHAHLNAAGHDLMLPVAKAWFQKNMQSDGSKTRNDSTISLLMDMLKYPSPNNAEEAEYRNELLYDVIQSKSLKQFLGAIENDSVAKKQVLIELEHPNNDSIDLNNCIASLNKVSYKYQIARDMMASILKAKQNNCHPEKCLSGSTQK